MPTYDIRSGSILFKHTIDEIPNQSDQRFQPHVHEDAYELLYYLSGDASFNLGGRIYDVREGTMLLIKPGIEHNIIFKSQKKYERITIRFCDIEIPEEIRNGLRKTENIYFVRNTQLSKEILHLDVHYSNVDKNLVLYAFKNSLNVILSYLVNYKTVENHPGMPEDIKTILDYIDDHLIEIEDLAQLCEEMHISRSALCRRFTEGYGLPIMTYVRAKKCLLADDLIKKGEKPTKVYKDCGFNDYPSFYRAYKKYLGRSPSKAENKTSLEEYSY